MTETRACPECGHAMMDLILPVNPPMHVWRCHSCGCDIVRTDEMLNILSKEVRV